MKYFIYLIIICAGTGCSFSKDKAVSPQTNLPIKMLSKQEVRREQLIRAVLAKSDLDFQNQIKSFTREELNASWENGSGLFDYLFELGNLDRLKFCIDMGLAPYTDKNQAYLFDKLRARAYSKIGLEMHPQEGQNNRTSVQIALSDFNSSVIDEIYESLSSNKDKAFLISKSASISCGALSYSIFLKSMESGHTSFSEIIDFIRARNCAENAMKPDQASDLWLLVVHKEFRNEFNDTSLIKYLADNYSNLPAMIPIGDQRILASIGFLYETSKVCRFGHGEVKGKPNVLCAQQTGMKATDGSDQMLPSERYISYYGDPYSQAPTKTEIFRSYIGPRFSSDFDVIVLDKNGVYRTGTKCTRGCLDPNGSSELTTSSNFMSRSIYLVMHGYSPLREMFTSKL